MLLLHSSKGRLVGGLSQGDAHQSQLGIQGNIVSINTSTTLPPSRTLLLSLV